MNRSELAAKVAQVAEIDKKTAGKAVSAVFDVLTQALKEEEKVQITGFGTFEVRERAARQGHNPSTGEAIEIPASKTPVFKASKTLRVK